MKMLMLKTSGELELFKIQWIVVQMPPLNSLLIQNFILFTFQSLGLRKKKKRVTRLLMRGRENHYCLQFQPRKKN